MTDEAVVQILKVINDFREEFREEKRNNEKRWEQNEIRWKENEKRWEQNEMRWKENEKRWEQNEMRWQENERLRQRNKKDIEKIFWRFETLVDGMYEENKNRIIKIEHLCPKCKIKSV